MNEKIIGLDVGDVRIGVAASDNSQVLASPVTVVERKAGEPVRKILDILKSQSSNTVVVGLPLNMDGTEGHQAAKVRRFAKQLAEAQPQLEVHYQDERSSTLEARARQRESGASKKKRAQPVDHLAATVLLQAWLDRQRRQREILLQQ